MAQDFRKIREFSVIGAGNLGSNLIYALREKGYRLKYVYDRSKYGEFRKFIQKELSKVITESQVVFICTSESVINGLANRILNECDVKGKFFFHTSSFLSSDILTSLKSSGAFTAALSPVQTLPGFERRSDIFRGIFWLAEGDQNSLELAKILTKDLNSEILIVNGEQKKYIHIASVIASNFMVSLLKFSKSMLNKAGSEIKPDVLRPLIDQTLENIDSHGVDKSLSGPAARGDSMIIREHLKLLEGDQKKLYRLFTKILMEKSK